MSDFIVKLKKLTRSALNKTTHDDVKVIFDSFSISDWKSEMEDLAKSGHNHICIWKFRTSEYVVFTDNDSYDISEYPMEEESRSYTASQFFNSKAFKEVILDEIPECKLHYDSIDCEN